MQGAKDFATQLRIIFAQLRYYMHIPNPEELPTEVWTARFNELQYIRQKEKEEWQQRFQNGS